MNAVASFKSLSPTVRQLCWLLGGLVVTSLVLISPDSLAATAGELASGGTVEGGLGDRIGAASADLGTGFWAAVKVLAAAIGLAMVAYSLYGMTLGRKKDEREYPLGQTLMVGVGGAIMLSLLAFAELAQTSLFGGAEDTENVSEGQAIFDGG